MRVRGHKIQFVWFLGKPILHWWAYPPDYKDRPVFRGKPVMWRLGLVWVEIRIFPSRVLTQGSSDGAR